MPYLGVYNDNLMFLSIFIAIISSYAAFDIMHRIYRSTRKGRVFWIAAGSYILGLGIWTTHFIGMLSYDIHANVTYNLALNVSSLLVSWMVSFITFYFVVKQEQTLFTGLICTFIMSTGFMSVHFLGMRSLHMEFAIEYNFLLASLSVILAYLVSWIGFYLFNYFRNNEKNRFKKTVLSAVFVGCGIACVHYMAMEAVSITGVPDVHKLSEIIQFDKFSYHISAEELGYAIGLAVIMIVVTIVILAYFDKSKAEKLQKLTKAQYKSLIEHNPCIVFTVDTDGIIQDVNPKGLEMINEQKEEIVSKSLFSYFKEEEQSELADKFTGLYAKKIVEFETFIRVGESKWVPMIVSFVPIIIDKQLTGVFVIARDITDLMESKEHIRKAQRELKNTLHNQLGLIFKYVKMGNSFIHTLCDGQLLYKMGYTPAMVIGKDFREYMPKDEIEVNLKAYKKAWEGEITTYEANISGFDVYVSLTPVYRNGKVIEVIGSVVDITDRLKAEQVTRKNEERYRNILNVMSEGVMLYGADHEKIALNDNIYEMFGMGKEEFHKQTIYENTLDLIKEDGSPLSDEEFPIRISLITGKEVKGEIIGQRHGEKIHWYSVNTKLLELQDPEESPKVLMTMSDITFQKEQEFKLRESNALQNTILDSMPIGMGVIDKSFNIIALNRPICEILGIDKPLRELVGTNMMDYYFPQFKENEQQEIRLQDILSNKVPAIDVFETLDHRILERRYFPFYMDEELNGHLWVLEDITDRKQMEQGLIEAKEEAIKANLGKSEFLSKMSHELRTPLNGILGFSQLLEIDQSLTDQQQQFVQEILKGGQHLLSLINEVLDLSRIEIGKMRISKDLVEISSIINDCLNLLQPSANKKGIQMKKGKQCIDRYVSIDEVRFRQIIINLLDNAIKYNKENGSITLTCDNTDEALVIHVIDSGLGIPAEEQTRIFEPFYRLKHPHIDGTGIGLPLVKQLINLMGGEMGLSSEAGKGSDFWFSLPLDKTNTDEIHQPDGGPYIHTAPNDHYQVLYIEDNLSNIQLVSEILGIENGINLLTAKTGKKGLQLARMKDIDLILLDIHLPDMTGFDVLEQLKENSLTDKIPIIALSANAMPDDISHALANGFEEYITKPIHISTFLKTISKYL